MIATAAGRLEDLWRLVREGEPRRLILVAALLCLVGGIFPAYLGIELTRGTTVSARRGADSTVSLARLLDGFDRAGFELPHAGQEPLVVPRVFVANLPGDWSGLADTADRKLVFTKIVLPLVLRANEMLLNRRARLLEISARLGAGKRLSAKARAWIAALAANYELEAPEITRNLLNNLKHRVDIVPASLAIAQAAIESGWGTSRFTAEGNALYGQWAEEGDAAMVPAGRDAGRTYAIKSFDTLQDSVLAYMHNLNTHRAYRQFRAARRAQRQAGRGMSGLGLAAYLSPYSQKGKGYVRDLTEIIKQNKLDVLDNAALQNRAGASLARKKWLSRSKSQATS